MRLVAVAQSAHTSEAHINPLGFDVDTDSFVIISSDGHALNSYADISTTTDEPMFTPACRRPPFIESVAE